MQFSPRSSLGFSNAEINSEISFSPHLTEEQKQLQQDITNREIVGNLIYKQNTYNEVLSAPVYDKNSENEKYQVLSLLYSQARRNREFNNEEEKIDHENNIEYVFVDLDEYLTKNKANMGYEKLENAIESNQSATFYHDIDTLDDFTQIDDYTSFYNNSYSSLQHLIAEYYDDVEIVRNAFISEEFDVKEKDTDYHIEYNPEKQHIYINDYPTLSIDENQQVRLLNENLSKDLEKSFFNQNHNFAFSDYKTLGEDSYIDIDLRDYENERGMFLEEFITDVSAKDLIKDSYKQRLNQFYDRGYYELVSVIKKDFDNFTKNNGLEHLDRPQMFTELYKDIQKEKEYSIDNNIDVKSLSHKLNMHDSVDEIQSNKQMYFDMFENEIRNTLPLDQDDKKELLHYLRDVQNDFVGLINVNEERKSSVMLENSLVALDYAKYDLDFSSKSLDNYSERKSYYEGMKAAILPLNNIAPNKYKSREEDIEVIGHFRMYLGEELDKELKKQLGNGNSLTNKNIEFKPDFKNDTLKINNSSIPFEKIIYGDEETHKNIIEDIKEKYVIDINQTNDLTNFEE